MAPRAELAPDQLAAVAHGSGPARIIAPAGSGKTRVLTERYRHLLADRGYEREAVVALAYNKKAQEEMASRLPGLGARIQTINAWGYAHPQLVRWAVAPRCSTSARCARSWRSWSLRSSAGSTPIPSRPTSTGSR